MGISREISEKRVKGEVSRMPRTGVFLDCFTTFAMTTYAKVSLKGGVENFLTAF